MSLDRHPINLLIFTLTCASTRTEFSKAQFVNHVENMEDLCSHKNVANILMITLIYKVFIIHTFKNSY